MLGPLLMREDVIAADGNQLGVEFAEVIPTITEGTNLSRASARPISRIKSEDHIPALKAGKLHPFITAKVKLLLCRPGKLKIRGRLSDLRPFRVIAAGLPCSAILSTHRHDRQPKKQAKKDDHLFHGASRRTRAPANVKSGPASQRF